MIHESHGLRAPQSNNQVICSLYHALIFMECQKVSKRVHATVIVTPLTTIGLQLFTDALSYFTFFPIFERSRPHVERYTHFSLLISAESYMYH